MGRYADNGVGHCNVSADPYISTLLRLENNEKEKVYDYISKLKDSLHLQSLYYNLFAKKDDINLGQAFFHNIDRVQ